MLKKLALTDKHVAAICSIAQIGGLAAIFIACGIMYHAYEIMPGPAAAGAAGVIAYGLALWINTGVEERIARAEDYADGYNAARRKLIEAGWQQARSPERPESVLPAELMEDVDALVIDHEEAARAHQASADRGRAILRAVAGVNLFASELKAELAAAQVRAARAEAALDDIRGGLARYAYAPPPQAPAAEPAPVAAASAAEEPVITMEHIEVPAPPAARPESKTMARLSSSTSIQISPPDDGQQPPGFLLEPREIELDARKTEDALIRLRGMNKERAWPLTDPLRTQSHSG